MKKTFIHCATAFLAVCLSAQAQAELIARDNVAVMELPQSTNFILRPRSNDDCNCVISGFNGYTMEPTTPTTTDNGGSIRKVDTNGRGDLYFYTPPANADPTKGSDSFTYTLRNDAGESDTAVQHIVFTPVIPPTNAESDQFNVVSGVETRLKINTNDSANFDDPTGSFFENEANQWSLNGGRVKFGTGQNRDLLIYKSKAGFTGEDKVWYTLEGKNGTDWAEVTINVVANRNSGPLTGVLDAVSTNAPITIDPLANDIGSGTLTLNPTTSTWTQRGGRVFYNGNVLRYIPNGNLTGQDKIWYTFSDAQGNTSWGEIRIEVQADFNTSYPQGTEDLAATTAGKTIPIKVLANDFGRNLTLEISSAYTLRGGLVGTFAGGKVAYYKPKAGFTGEDKFWYNLKDDAGRQNWGAVTINVD